MRLGNCLFDNTQGVNASVENYPCVISFLLDIFEHLSCHEL